RSIDCPLDVGFLAASGARACFCLSFRASVCLDQSADSLCDCAFFSCRPDGVCAAPACAVFYLLKSRGNSWGSQESFLFWFAAGLIGFSFSAGVCWPPAEVRMYYPEVLSRLFLRATPFLMLLWSQRVWGSRL